jgi:TRAP-type C4-dicarboxylate transport system substrate-binding protein
MRATKFAVLLAALLILSPPGRTAALTIKIASLVPEGSPWHWALLKMASEWQAISDGRVRMKIYAGGIAGDETDTIRNASDIAGRHGHRQGLGHTSGLFVYQLPFVTKQTRSCRTCSDSCSRIWKNAFRKKDSSSWP